MDYRRHLVLYSGGADSTYIIHKEESAKYLLHYPGRNEEQTKIAVVNANLLNRHLSIVADTVGPGLDGETNEIHALVDTIVILDACRRALGFGFKGVVLGFNADDIGIDVESVQKIVRRVDSNFEILQPLIKLKAVDIRKELEEAGIRYVSCLHSVSCGYCAKCKREY